MISTVAGEKTYALRLSPELYEQLRALAEKHERSVNWTIGRLLKKAVAERPEWHDEAMR